MDPGTSKLAQIRQPPGASGSHENPLWDLLKPGFGNSQTGLDSETQIEKLSLHSETQNRKLGSDSDTPLETGCLQAGWLVRWLAGWLAGCLGAWLTGWLAGWLPGWLAGWLAG